MGRSLASVQDSEHFMISSCVASKLEKIGQLWRLGHKQEMTILFKETYLGNSSVYSLIGLYVETSQVK